MPSITAIAGVSLGTLLLASSITATILYYKNKALQAQLAHSTLEVSQLTTSNNMLSYKITQQNEEIAKLRITRTNTALLASASDAQFNALLARTLHETQTHKNDRLNNLQVQVRRIDKLFRVFEGALDAAH